MPKNNEMTEKELLELEARGGLLPVNQTPVIRPDLRPGGAPPTPITQPPNFQGTLPVNLQLQPDIERTQYGNSVATFRLMPVGPAGVPSINTSGQNQAEPARQAAAVAQTTATTAQSTATAAQSTANTAVAKTFQGAWNNSTAYVVGASVDQGGLIYLCILGNTNEMPPNATYWSPLSGSTSYQGNWSSATAYTTGELVTAAGNIYFALQNSTNENPATSPSYWQILSNTSYYYGTWSSSDNYPVGGQVSYQGNFYVATTANTNETPSTTSSYWTLIGTSAILIGTWSSSTAYVAGNQVSYTPSGGATNYYICLQANTNETPGAATTAYWYLISNNTAVNAASSYRPTTNPLSAIDAGSSATITIASFTMAVAGYGNISVSGGSLTGLSYSTLYFVYYADPSISGGSVTFQDATVKTSAISSGVDFFVGSITTPPATGAETFGNLDGGIGAQSGFAVNLFAQDAAFSNSGDWTNTADANDGNINTEATCTISAATVSNRTLSLTEFGNLAYPQGTAVLNVRTAVPTLSNGTVTLAYSTGGSFTNIYSVTSTRALTTDQVTLPANLNFTNLIVKITYSTSVGSVTIDFYEAWVSVTG